MVVRAQFGRHSMSKLIAFQWRRKSKCFNFKWQTTQMLSKDDIGTWLSKIQKHCPKIEVVVLGATPMTFVPHNMRHLSDYPFDHKANLVDRKEP
jgi:hypothetical protein